MAIFYIYEQVWWDWSSKMWGHVEGCHRF